MVEQINLFRSQEGNKKEVRHSDLLAKIEKRFSAKINERKISLVESPDSKGEMRKMYELPFEYCLRILMDESETVQDRCVEVMKEQQREIERLQKPKTQIEILLGSVQMLAEQEQRLSSVEFRLNQIEQNKQLALNELSYIERSTNEVPEIGIRLKINQIVRSYSEKTNIPHDKVWEKMYSKMLYAYRFNVNAYKKLRKNESKIDIVERENQLDNLFALVSRELV